MMQAMRSAVLVLLAMLALCGCQTRTPEAPVSPVTPAAPFAPPVPATPVLHSSLQALYSEKQEPRCSAPQFCGDLVAIDCLSAADGPRNYYDNRTGEVLMQCGGACMLPSADPKVCKSCPPKQWACPE